MSTDRDIHEPPELAAGAAVDAPRPNPRPDHTTATAGASQPHDEATMRTWEGRPPETTILADARVYANPSGATTALGGNHQNGWSAFRRMSDRRLLGDLRTELQARRGF